MLAFVGWVVRQQRQTLRISLRKAPDKDKNHVLMSVCMSVGNCRSN